MLKVGIHGNPGSGNHPKERQLTSTTTLKGNSGNSLPSGLNTYRETSKPRGRKEREHESSKICPHKVQVILKDQPTELDM